MKFTEKINTENEAKKKFLSRFINYPITISDETSYLCFEINKDDIDFSKIKEKLIKIKKESESFLREIGEFENLVSERKESSKLKKVVKPTEILSSAKDSNDAINQELQRKIAALNNKRVASEYSNVVSNSPYSVITSERVLPNGGMAPPKIKTASEVNIEFFEQSKLVEEMREMKKNGISFNQDFYNKNKKIEFKDFAETFKYLEDVKDYNGSFLISVLKSSLEIVLQEGSLELDLTKEKALCENGNALLLSVYDIMGSTLENEQKKFLLLVKFDELYGILKIEKVLFNNNQSFELSKRQKEEMTKFCKIKKLIHETVR